MNEKKRLGDNVSDVAISTNALFIFSQRCRFTRYSTSHFLVFPHNDVAIRRLPGTIACSWEG